jgi:hypothetical protein
MRIAQQAQTNTHASFQQESTAMVCVAWFPGGSGIANAGWTWTGQAASANASLGQQSQAPLSIYEVAIAQAKRELALLASRSTPSAPVSGRNLFLNRSDDTETTPRLTLDSIITLN